MIKKYLLILALSTTLPIVLAGNAYAQDTSNPDTEQTDQSEEDWRNSKKKKTDKDVFQDVLGSISNGGWTIDTTPPGPVESLPEDSRRHMMKERARVMAETEPGEEPKAVYNLSEEAKADPDLAEQENEAWEVIMTDLKSSGGGDQGEPQDGPNKVAVTGQGSGSSSSTMRGGSTATAAEIMAAIKSGRMGGGNGQGQTPESQGNAPTGPMGTGGSSETDPQDQGQSQQGTQQGTQPGGQGPSTQSGPRGGSSGSIADILGAIKKVPGVPKVPSMPKIPGTGRVPGGKIPGSGQTGEGRQPSDQGQEGQSTDPAFEQEAGQDGGQSGNGETAPQGNNPQDGQSSEASMPGSVMTGNGQEESQSAAAQAADQAATQAAEAANKAADQAIESGNSDAIRAAAEAGQAAQAARQAAQQAAEATDQSSAEAAAQTAKAEAENAAQAAARAAQGAGQDDRQAQQVEQETPSPMEQVSMPTTTPVSTSTTGSGAATSAYDFIRQQQDDEGAE